MRLSLKYFREQGRIGGLTRAAKLTKQRRSEIAKAAVTAREEKRHAKKSMLKNP